MLGSELGNFPAWKVVVHPVEKCTVVVHLFRERREQVRGLEHRGNALVDVTYEYNGCIGIYLVLATGKGTGCHIILHDLDAILVLELDTCNLVKGYNIPQAY
ncbi:MAG: hypothetical protein A4E23_00092 [Methanomethylovorans sp. PtaU1.Bin073]|nr:MAG: hypothetical protein A4E23_00092 [Methanomethylovorans sp. PtaU1.Bin073]